MKNSIFLFVLLIQLMFTGCSQERIIFKIKYKPETKYNQTMEQTSQTEVKYSGSEEFLQKLKDKGAQNPTINNTKSKIESIFKTGKLTDGKRFPLTLEIINTTRGDGKKFIPDGTIIYGHGTIDNVPSFDSISSPGMNEQFKSTILQTMQSLFSQVILPEKEIKIGDEFSQETPISIPVAGINFKMVIKTNYKLIDIVKGVGDFDINQVYTFDTESNKDTIKATGKGKGKLLYDIEKGFDPEYQIDTDIEMNMNVNNLSLYIKSKSNIVQKTEVSKE
ncbi:MAG: hypothetical protein P4L45_08500 [Ignavibacteriaceae bacterium]|nr:hypothetical protein [Ignavibacteriaceae bacterium]